MKKITVEKRREIEALTNDGLPKNAWTLALSGNLEDYNSALNGLLKLRAGVRNNPDLFDGEIPKNYLELARKFTSLTDLIKDAFGQ